MFKKGDLVYHDDYGNGIITDISPNHKITSKDRNGNEITHIGTLSVNFYENSDKEVQFLSDGRGTIPGAGYFSYGEFIEYISYVEITKID